MNLNHHMSNTFSYGEVDPSLLGHINSNIYQSAAHRLLNVSFDHVGGVKRRPGMKLSKDLSGRSRLLEFAHPDQKTRLLVFSDTTITVMRHDGSIQATITDTPWREDDLDSLNAVSLQGTMIICSARHKPYIVMVDGRADIILVEFSFSYNNNNVALMPWAPVALLIPTNFALSSLQENNLYAVDGNLAAMRNRVLVGDLFRFKGLTLRATEMPNSRRIVAKRVSGTQVEEEISVISRPMFSDQQGWPTLVTLFQGRLIFANTKTFPHWIFASRSGDYTNFDVGDASDDKAIALPLTDTVNKPIIALLTSDRLLVCNGRRLWSIDGNPITPSNVKVKPIIDLAITTGAFAASAVDNTLFLARKEKISFYQYSSLSDGYLGTDTTLYCRHLIGTPKRCVYQVNEKQLLVLMDDGQIVMGYIDTQRQISAYSQWHTDGIVEDILIHNDKVWLVVARQGIKDTFYTLEYLDHESYLDSATHTQLTIGDDLNYSIFIDKKHYNHPYAVLAYGSAEDLLVKPTPELNTVPQEKPILSEDPFSPQVVVIGYTENAGILLPIDPETYIKNYQHGRPFTVLVIPLPVALKGVAHKGVGKRIRISQLVVRVEKTLNAEIDFYKDHTIVHSEKITSKESLAFKQRHGMFSGDFITKTIGWQKLGPYPLWGIRQKLPGPFHLLMTNQDIRVFDLR